MRVQLHELAFIAESLASSLAILEAGHHQMVKLEKVDDLSVPYAPLICVVS